MSDYLEAVSKFSEAEKANELMILKFEARFWKLKAWRAEQQRDREIKERKEIEDTLGKYKDIPQERLDAILLEMKKAELASLEKEVNSLLFKVGHAKMTMLNIRYRTINDIDEKIKFWKNALDTYARYEPSDSE